MYFKDLLNEYSTEELIEENRKLRTFKENVLRVFLDNVKHIFETTPAKSVHAPWAIVGKYQENVFYYKDEPRFYYDVSFVLTPDGAGESYGSDFWSWEEYALIEITPASIELFGEKACILAILDEMSFDGIYYDDSCNYREEHKDKLINAITEYENDPGVAIPAEKVIANLRNQLDAIDDRPLAERLKVDAKNKNIDYGNHLMFCYIKSADFFLNCINRKLTADDRKTLEVLIKQGMTGVELYKNFLLARDV